MFMNFSKNIILPCLLFSAVLLVVTCFTLPKPELTISIFIRLLSSVIALYIVIKYREWRVMFLSIMFFLMATRQFLTLLIWMKVLERNAITHSMSELPGFIVTFLSLLSIIYLGLILSGKIKLIQTQEDNILTLKSLLPICAKCKRIRDDEGYWKEIEAYIETHTDSQFSHGLCEECSDKLYGNEAWYQNVKKKRKDMA